MQEIKMNKKYNGVYNSYLKSRMYALHQLYKSYSYHKAQAFDYCVDLCNKLNGYNLKIIGGNSMSFSVGFMFKKDNIEYFAYITKDYNRIMKIEE